MFASVTPSCREQGVYLIYPDIFPFWWGVLVFTSIEFYFIWYVPYEVKLYFGHGISMNFTKNWLWNFGRPQHRVGRLSLTKTERIRSKSRTEATKQRWVVCFWQKYCRIKENPLNILTSKLGCPHPWLVFAGLKWRRLPAAKSLSTSSTRVSLKELMALAEKARK